MRLARYLLRRQIEFGDTIAAFARRAEVPLQTIYDVRNGSDMRLSTASALIRASKASPTATGEHVTFEDLLATVKVRQRPRFVRGSRKPGGKGNGAKKRSSRKRGSRKRA